MQTQLKAGMKFKFTPTGNVLTLAKVTEKNVSWPTAAHKGGNGKNVLRTAGTSVRIFLDGIAKGTYVAI